ncbi:ABC transporter permease [Candidatus Saccharibacteria bacterium]|nr:ABC transporter permease [Candidatus Saccharibacteria bacterium]
MAMLFRTHLKLARTSIKENRTRSFLTCLGIAIGIASIILILSLTGSISKLISSELESIGSDLIVVRPSSTKDGITSVIEELTSSNSFERSTLKVEDTKSISEIEQVTVAAPIALSVNTITNEDNTVASATILGTTTDFFTMEPLAFRYGTALSEKNKETSVVIGHMLSLYLFNTSNPVGRTLNFHGQRFIVVGVLEEVTDSINFNNIDYNNILIMDVNVLNDLIGSLQVQQINAKVANTSELASTAEAIQKLLLEQHSGDTNFTVSYGDAIAHPASSLLNIISGMLAIVASVSLVVGGIGVMNIMLVSVAERTHEIGIRKAVGASSRNILMQFMFESLIMSILGGIMGIILGYILAFFASSITPFAPYISWQILLIVFATTIGVGVIFGIYPAIKAASKNPIDSLKHYR